MDEEILIVVIVGYDTLLRALRGLPYPTRIIWNYMNYDNALSYSSQWFDIVKQQTIEKEIIDAGLNRLEDAIREVAKTI